MLKLMDNYTSFIFRSFLIIFYLSGYLSTNFLNYGSIRSTLANAQTCHCIKQFMPINERIEDLYSEMDTIKTTVQSLKVQSSSGQTQNLANMETKHFNDIQQLEKKIANLMTFFEGKINILDLKVNSNNNKISYYEKKIQQYANVEQMMNDKLDEKENKIKSLTMKLSSTESSLSSQISSCQNDITKLSSSLTALNNKVLDFESDLNNSSATPANIHPGTDSKLLILQTQVLQHENGINRINYNEVALKNQVKSLESVVTDMKTNMDSLTTNTVQRHIQALQNDLKLKIKSHADEIKRIDKKTRDSDVQLKDLIDGESQRKSKFIAIERQIEIIKGSYDQYLPTENQRKIKSLETIVQANSVKVQNEFNKMDNKIADNVKMINNLNQLTNKVSENVEKIVNVENICNAISLSVNNLKGEVNNLKSKVPADGGFISNVKLQEIVKRLEGIEKKPLILIEDFNKQLLHVINSFLSNVKYTNWYGINFQHRIYLEELYESGQLKYKFYLVH